MTECNTKGKCPVCKNEKRNPYHYHTGGLIESIGFDGKKYFFEKVIDQQDSGVMWFEVKGNKDD